MGSVSQEPRRPNILVIVADDLGFSDCGCFGSEIQTPHIDALTTEANALRFTNYHVTAACSPARSMLMTGTDHHIARLGGLWEVTRNSPSHRRAPGHEGYLNQRVVALPELLKDRGYHTIMFGKWHLGLKREHFPIARWFNKSFALLPGCANHYGWEPQYDDPVSEPSRFFETATRALHVEDEVIAHIAKYYNNSLENIGRKDSFAWYGSLWAQAATAPSRLFKGYSTEGGCRVPLVVKPPASHTLPTPTSEVGSITKAYCTVMDIVPTILDLAGLKHPGTSYQGREIAPLRGTSWKPFLDITAIAMSKKLPIGNMRIHDQNYVTGFECSGSGALVMGDWKVVFVPAPRGPHRWELFNVKADPGETTDLRNKEPAVFNEMMGHWEGYKKEVGVVGVADEIQPIQWGAQPGDEFEDPYGWIKLMGRPERVPEHLKGLVPV
ncbi:hypothetical protein ACJ41O_011865 [Fusarium nematophilum]